MKRHLAPALFSLSLCAVMGGVRTAGAQTLTELPPLVADSASVAPPSIAIDADLASTPPTLAPREQFMAGGPMILAPTTIPLGTPGVRASASPVVAPVAMANWKMPTSRALMIGGAATAIIGVAVIGHDTGAIVALSGAAVAVYGLYLHYNR
jgi:hypothetical protein